MSIKSKKVKGRITTIEFAKKTLEASTAVSISKPEEGTYRLSLQQLSTPLEIGEKLNPNDIEELPVVNLDFHHSKSIDVVIAYLRGLQKNMLEDQCQPCFAC